MNKRDLRNRLTDRMTRFGFLMIVYILAFCASPSATMSAQPAAKGPIQAFTQEIERLRKELKIPGLSVAVIQDHQVVFADGFGYADIKNKILANANTPYNIASCTKPFAAAVLMKLVEAGQLDLDDEMADILKDSVFSSLDGTIRGYASGCKKIKEMSEDTSSPYARLFKDYRCDTERITVRHHLTHTSQAVPGEAYRYNGFLYGLLSKVAEEVSGKGFAELLVDNIIGPLELTRTIPSISDSHRDQVLADRAKYYRVGDTGDFVLSGYSTKLSAAAGMISTVLDLAKFDIAMDRNLIVSEDSKEAMFTPTISNSGQPLPYGLGWFVQEHEGVRLIWHYGWAPKAYSSLILKVPQEEITLILLANSDGASAPFRLGDGNVLTSPFAVMFLNLFTKLKVKANIPITGAIQNVHELDKALRTYIDIIIGKGFTGNLPDDIDTITVTGPKGDLPIGKDDFIYIPQLRDFFVRLPGSPEIGTYTFKVASGTMSGSAVDTQSVVRTIPLLDISTFSPAIGATLRSNTLTFSWRAVNVAIPIYYRLEIYKQHGGRVYSTRYVKGMLSHTVPDGVLKPGQAYRWRLRVADGDNWVKVQNRSQSKWRSFTMAQLFEYIDQAPEKTGVYPGEGWRKVKKPELLGWSSEKLAAARVYSEQIGSAAVMIVDDGVVVDAWGDITRKFECHSMRKSLLSALIGIHVEEGDIDLSKTMEELGIDDNEPSLTETEKLATVGDLIKARSGIYHPALYESIDMKAMRPKRHSHAPGTFYYYNNWDFNALGTIFEQETGTKIFQEFDRRIAKPLQIEDFKVSDCHYVTGDDSIHPAYPFRMSARDLARFGLLFLREGRWQGRHIISADWVRESTASHSKRGIGGGYGYMWWTGVKSGLLPNVSVKEHSYYAAGWGGHRVFVLPYRKLVVVHRANTDSPGRQVRGHHIGRLLWLILSAAGETEIGEDPSIEAAKGVRLTADDLKQLLEGGSEWVGPNNGISPGGESLVMSCSRDGELSLSATEGLEFKGKWWISGDRFHFKILGERAYFLIVQDGNTIKLFDPTGTLFGKFNLPAN